MEIVAAMRRIRVRHLLKSTRKGFFSLDSNCLNVEPAVMMVLPRPQSGVLGEILNTHRSLGQIQQAVCGDLNHSRSWGHRFYG